MASRGRGARIKGANFERELAKKFRDSLNIKAYRGLTQTRGGGEEVADVHMDYIHVEAKRQKRCNIKAALNQAISDCAEKEDKLPVAITKNDREPILVTMLWEDWIEIFKSYVELQKDKPE